MNTDLQGKAVVISGGTRGIGRAAAGMFASQGCRVAICGRDDEALKLTVEEIQAHAKTDILGVKANTAKLNDVRRFVGSAARKFGRIDILVNNAGDAHIGGIGATTDEDWEYHIQLKLLGYIRMAREVLPHMKAAGGGTIINVVGMAAREPGPYFMVPGVTNGALLSFTKSLSSELAPDNIRVTAVNPGTTDTPLTERTVASLATLLNKPGEEVLRTLFSPLGRLATADEVAAVIVFLASAAGRFVSGTAIDVDAGRSQGMW